MILFNPSFSAWFGLIIGVFSFFLSFFKPVIGEHHIWSRGQNRPDHALNRDHRQLLWHQLRRAVLVSAVFVLCGRHHCGHVHTWPTHHAHQILLCHFEQLLVQHHRSHSRSDHGKSIIVSSNFMKCSNRIFTFFLFVSSRECILYRRFF